MSNTIPGKGKLDFTLVIAGREIPVQRATFTKTIDTIANEVKCSFPWFPGLDPEIDRLTAPYSYSECKIYMGGQLVMIGILYNVIQTLNSTGRIKNLEIYSKTANIVDSSVRFPFEENNLDLLERIESQMNSTVPNRKMNINVFVDGGVDIGGKFKRISVKSTDNCFDKLRSLARQRGLLLSCTVEGDVLITYAKVTGDPVGTITEEIGITPNFEARFNGRDRFQYYQANATSSSSKKTKTFKTSKDIAVKTERFLTFQTEDNLPGEALNAAEWRKNKSAAEAMSTPFPVNTWYAPNGSLWSENTLLTVKSETMSIKNGFTFLITQVEFVFENQGCTANLELKPPTVYTTGEIIEPWLEG